MSTSETLKRGWKIPATFSLKLKITVDRIHQYVEDGLRTSSSLDGPSCLTEWECYRSTERASAVRRIDIFRISRLIKKAVRFILYPVTAISPKLVYNWRQVMVGYTKRAHALTYALNEWFVKVLAYAPHVLFYRLQILLDSNFSELDSTLHTLIMFFLKNRKLCSRICVVMWSTNMLKKRYIDTRRLRAKWTCTRALGSLQEIWFGTWRLNTQRAACWTLHFFPFLSAFTFHHKRKCIGEFFFTRYEASRD